MANKVLDFIDEQMEDEKDVRRAINLFVWAIIVAVVALCEIMYIKIMVLGFPDGLVQIIAIIGAVATGLSVLALYAGKNHWFSKGPQTWAAWAFTAVEIGVLVLNVLLAFNFNERSLAFWKQAYPAAPIIALAGWGFILYLDRTNIMRRKQRTMQEKEHDAELKYEHLVHRTRLAVKTSSLEIVAAKLEEKLAQEPNQQAMDNIADEIFRGILGEIRGKHYTQLPAPRIVDGSVQKPKGQIGKPVDADELPDLPPQRVSPDYDPGKILSPAEVEELRDFYKSHSGLDDEELMRKWEAHKQSRNSATSPLTSPPLNPTAQAHQGNGNNH